MAAGCRLETRRFSYPAGPACWDSLVDAHEIARCFDLGPGARLSDGPVPRGKEGVVWRLDTLGGETRPFNRPTRTR